jgi:hydrogenase maturation protein HypF
MRSGLPVIQVQHHHAHVAGCAAENDLRGPYLGVGWDGTGYGLDATIWGGEFFLVNGAGFERVAHPRPFRLPGGEAAIKQGWRAAASLLYQTFGSSGLDGVPHRAVMERILERGLNAPVTTSVGRLFDAASHLAGVASESRFEGQAAMLLERAMEGLATDEAYQMSEDGDWRPLVEAMVEDRRRGVEPARMAARFHNALAGWIVAVAGRAGVEQVALSGGVFQNSYLVERAARELEARGYRVATHQRVPANDGGIALGQAVLASLMEA